MIFSLWVGALTQSFFHASARTKYLLSIMLTLLISTSWYYLCYSPFARYLCSKRIRLEQMRQKKAILVKRLVSLQSSATELAQAQKCIDERWAAMLRLNTEAAQGLVSTLCATHNLTCVKQRLIKREFPQSPLLDALQHISYVYQIQGSYHDFIDFFADLKSNLELAHHCKRLHIKRSTDQIICTLMLDFIGKKS